MGCDGGTIPRRDELVKTKKKPEAKDKESELMYKWRYCSITQQILQKPIVMCYFGKLYNKVSIIEALISKNNMPECAKHIKSLKDIRDLHLTPNPAYKDIELKEGTLEVRAAPYICPIIGLEMSGKFRFVGLWSCGCVFSERALKEVKTKICHKCQKPFDDSKDVVIINGNDDDNIIMKYNHEMRQKNKKFNKIKIQPSEASTSTSLVDDETKNNKLSEKIIPKVEKKSRNGSIKRSSYDNNEKESIKKMKPEYSVAKDPKVSDVYKSIFTSHKSEKEQNRAHWVTYNPFYN